jgi:hypothetical protein
MRPLTCSVTLALALAAAGTQNAPALPRLSTAIQLETTADPSANVSMGDLDGDGDLDIVLAKGRHDPYVDKVLLNDGKGHFVTSDLGSTADRTYTAALADLDVDGDLDVVVSNDAPDQKLLYFNDGKGRFTVAGTWGDPKWSTRNAAIADLNGDGRPDVIAANRPGPSYACLNDGHGKLVNPCVPIPAESATSIVPADFDKDGHVDLAVPSRDGGQSHIYFNDGKARFARTIAFGPSNAAARVGAAADFNGDGTIDLAVGDETAASLTVYMNDGKGRLTDGFHIADKERTPYAMTAADLNGDRHPDIVLGYTEGPHSTTDQGSDSLTSSSVRRPAPHTGSPSATSTVTASPTSRSRARVPRTCCTWATNKTVVSSTAR